MSSVPASLPLVSAAYGAQRLRIPVHTKGEVDILKTYGDLIDVLADDKFRCFICVRRAAIIGTKEDALKPLSRLVQASSACA